MDSAADQLLALKPEQCRQRGVGANDPIVEGYFGEAYRVEGRVEPLFRLDEFGYFDIDDGEASSGDMPLDRKSVVSGKSVSVRVDLGGRRILKKKTKYTT